MLVVALLLTAVSTGAFAREFAPPTPNSGGIRSIRSIPCLPGAETGALEHIRTGASGYSTVPTCVDRNDGATIGRSAFAEWNGLDRRTATAPRSGTAGEPRRARQVRIVQWLRAVPIRWRILSIAALNSAVVVVLAVLIWNGAKVLGSAWDDVRQVRESDKILALLESETSRLQNLIHRYINQPSPELFAEILLLREAVLGTLTTRAANRPDAVGIGQSGSNASPTASSTALANCARCRPPSPRPMSEQVLGPAGTWPGSIRSSRAPPGIATR